MKDYVHFSANDFVMDKYFQDWVRCPNPENNAFWRNWIATHPQKAAEIEEARFIVQHLTIPQHHLAETEVSELWNRIRTTGMAAGGGSWSQNEGPKMSSWWSLVAAAVIILGIAFYSMMASGGRISHETAYGETRSIVLPDQSVVTLNANSRLSYVENWDEVAVREVYISGEAYFSVTHQKNNQPFVVKTDDGVSVEVLGTTFNVYNRTHETKVLLNSGKISLKLPTVDAEETIIMKPGELVEFRSNEVIRKKVDPEKYVAWTEHKLILDHTSLREMVKMLRENYGLEVEVLPPSLLDQTVSGSMPAAEEAELIDQIAKAFRLEATREGNRLIMKE